MNPSMAATVILGIWLLSYSFAGYLSMAWMHVILLLVTILIAYHIYCGRLLRQFQQDNNQHGHVFYRWFNEFPVLLLIAITILVVVKPF